jgi:hypothetical protein
MKAFPLLLLCVLFCSESFAQRTKPISVNTGAGTEDEVPDAAAYQYSQFVNGRVVFKSGVIADAKLNYNIFLDEMQFITINADTLALDNEETIRIITVNNDSFYYDKGYLLLVTSNSMLKLAVKQGFRILDRQKKTAYGGSSAISSIRNINAYSNGRRVFNVGVSQDVILEKDDHYYIGDKYGHFVLASKKNLLQLLPKHNDSIRQYLKENEIEFHKKEDMEKLFQFLVLL